MVDGVIWDVDCSHVDRIRRVVSVRRTSEPQYLSQHPSFKVDGERERGRRTNKGQSEPHDKQFGPISAGCEHHNWQQLSAKFQLQSRSDELDYERYDFLCRVENLT